MNKTEINLQEILYQVDNIEDTIRNVSPINRKLTPAQYKPSTIDRSIDILYNTWITLHDFIHKNNDNK